MRNILAVKRLIRVVSKALHPDGEDTSQINGRYEHSVDGAIVYQEGNFLEVYKY